MQTPFFLDGRMDLVLGFDAKLFDTPLYNNTDVCDQMFLAESVSCQLRLIYYQRDVESQNEGRKKSKVETSKSPVSKLACKVHQWEGMM